MKVPADQELLRFPCDYVFKIFGEKARREKFVESVLAAIGKTVPVGLDALRERDSRNGKYICLSVVVRVHSRAQIEEIYSAIRSVEGLSYLL